MRANEFLSQVSLLETPDQIRDQIIKKVSRIKDEDDLTNINKYANQYFFKKDVANLSKAKNYQDSVSDIILQAVGRVQGSTREIKAFLNAVATTGIIVENKLLSPGSIHSLESMIDPLYTKIFSQIKGDLYRKLSGVDLGDKGAVGKGEYLLSILSPNIVRRGAPGDIAIDNTKVEIKAGKNGRLGPAGSVSLIGRLPKFITKCIRAGLLTQEYVDQNPPDPIALNFKTKDNMIGFTSYFENDPKRILGALSIMIKMHYPSLDADAIAGACVTGASINGAALKKELLRAAYTVYQTAKGFDGILIADEEINNYLYINSSEGAAAAASLVTAGYPAWSGGQTDCVKVTLAKRIPK
jgi:hypothetical protein